MPQSRRGFPIYRRPPALFLSGSICWATCRFWKLLARAGDLVGGISRLQPARFGSYRKRLGGFRIYRPSSVRVPRIGRCDGRQKFPFECPIYFWTSRQQGPALRCGLGREPLLDGGYYDQDGRGMGPSSRPARARIEECGRPDQAKN
jgi:hypothetical protein